ncbi:MULTISPECIES: hypothetical protein [Kamptonema]|uniref:hypothetical protein n=1 Tax=Kamptonema TaxID=1501433 RepID=UPI0001DACF00|nr:MULTISPECIES: hypothetical protein [Kamptonema]CBN55748.1 hypothetical protein OSCI_2420003 [Kamptonema sp. PCC 6506]
MTQIQRRQLLWFAVTHSGVLSIVAAGFLWGLYPIFWKASAIEVNQAIAACVPNSNSEGIHCTPP